MTRKRDNERKQKKAAPQDKIDLIKKINPEWKDLSEGFDWLTTEIAASLVPRSAMTGVCRPSVKSWRFFVSGIIRHLFINNYADKEES